MFQVTLPVRDEAVFKLKNRNKYLTRSQNDLLKTAVIGTRAPRVQYNKVFEMAKHLEKPLFVFK
jgi:hypothetical protein